MNSINWKRLYPAWATAIVIFIAASAAIYPSFEEVFRNAPGARETPLWLVDIGGVIVMSFFFTYIYSKGHEGTGWISEGFRYGLSIGLLVAAGYFIGYAFVTMTIAQLSIHILASIVKFTVAGLGIAFAYERSEAGGS